MSLHYVKTNYTKVPYESMTKIQREGAFMGVHLFFRGKSQQKSSGFYKLVEMVLGIRRFYQFPQETNVSLCFES